MNEFYEFRVAGLIGPLTRAAMPELQSEECVQDQTLTGTAPDESHISSLLDRLDDAHLTTNDIVISRSAHCR